MKNLVDYIRESYVKEGADPIQTSKDITFDFNGIEDAEDAIKKLQELGTESGTPVAVDNQKVTISFSKDTFEQAKDVIEYLDEFIKEHGKVTRRASDEQYAQKLHHFEDAVKELHAFKDECDAAGEPEPPVKPNVETDDKEKDDKEKDDKEK